MCGSRKVTLALDKLTGAAVIGRLVKLEQRLLCLNGIHEAG